jgi:hypothetical protein
MEQSVVETQSQHKESLLSLPLFIRLLVILAVFTVSRTGLADQGMWTYLKTVNVHAPGEMEYEQYVTAKWDYDDDDDGKYRFDFRHEFEFGITDNFQMAVYLADWRVKHSDSSGTITEFRTSALEFKYKFSDPVTDPIGFAGYGEFKIGSEKFALEGKALFQKTIDRWNFGYNFVLEAEWEDNGANGARYVNSKGKIANYLGIAYQVVPSFSVGAEILAITPIPDWAGTDTTRFYAGPALSYRGRGWHITTTFEVGLNRVPGVERFQLRTIFGIDF